MKIYPKFAVIHCLKALVWGVFGLLSACTSVSTLPDNVVQPHSLYIVVQRDPRLPAEFLNTLTQETHKRLPATDIKIDDGVVDDQVLVRAEWLIVLRASQIKPNYTYQPSNNSTINGITDCIAGSSFGPGVIITPCVYSVDNVVLDASVRDVSSKTLKTYTADAQDESWFWLLPVSAIADVITGKDQQRVWLDLIDTLYNKMQRDAVFSGGVSELAKQE